MANFPPPGRLRGAWQANTTYQANDIVRRPSDGALVAATVAFVSGGSYVAGDWTVLGVDASGSGGSYRGAYSSLAAGTAIKAGQLVSDSGAIWSRNADGTISGSFNAANWTQIGGGSGVQSGVANTFTAKQTFQFGVTEMKWISSDGSVAPELHFIAKNGSGPNSEAWGIGIDTAAPTKSRDFAIFKELASGGARDSLYASHNGLLEPQWGVNWPQPADRTGTIKAAFNACAPGAGGTSTEPTVSAFMARGAVGMTAPIMGAMLADVNVTLWQVGPDGGMVTRNTAGTIRSTVDGASGSKMFYADTTAIEMLHFGVAGVDTVGRLMLRAGAVDFGPGGTSAADAILQRGGANRIDTIDTEIRAFRASGAALAAATTGDANRRWQVNAAGQVLYGSGAASPDAWIERPGTAALRFGSGTTVANAGERFRVDGTGISFFGATPTAKATISGSRGGNAALASLLTELAAKGLITDSTSA